jgi:fructokinase
VTSKPNGAGNLYLQDAVNGTSVAVLGEVLWDVFQRSRQLGGAALNFAAHAKRLGYETSLISAVGVDSPGEEAAAAIAGLGLDTTFLQTTTRFQTGTARVQLGPGGRTRFIIERPAAYDAVRISDREIEQLIQRAPAWFYYGTLFSSSAQGEAVLQRLLGALPAATRLYDLNLRPGCHSASLVKQLLALADVVKLNEEELQAVHEFTGLPVNFEAFCREGARRFGWKAVCVTLGARGCAMLACGEYVEAAGQAIDVVDTVGAGDVFTAAFMHGLINRWPVTDVAAFANRVGALVASRHGAIPDWTIKGAVEL